MKDLDLFKLILDNCKHTKQVTYSTRVSLEVLNKFKDYCKRKDLIQAQVIEQLMLLIIDENKDGPNDNA